MLTIRKNEKEKTFSEISVQTRHEGIFITRPLLSSAQAENGQQAIQKSQKFSILQRIGKVEIVFHDQSVRGKGVKSARGGRGQPGAATGLAADMEGSIRKLEPAQSSV